MPPSDERGESGGLIARLLDDTSSGLRTDPDGRRYFRPRKVEFETIRINEKDLYSGGWKGYDALLPLDWNGSPSHDEIRNFAIQSSERFLKYWFEVFDVAVARSLFGPGREIFTRDFIKPDIFFDTGIPLDHEYSSVPKELHLKILEEYRRSLEFKSERRIFYISEYLIDLTADVIAVLRPYSELWDLRKLRKSILRKPEKLLQEIQSPYHEKIHGKKIKDILESILTQAALEAIDGIAKNQNEKKIRSDSLRNMIYLLKRESRSFLSRNELKLIFENSREIPIGPEISLLHAWLTLPENLYRNLRSSFLHLSSSHRLRMRTAKLHFLRSRFNADMSAETLQFRITLHEKAAGELSQRLKKDFLEPLSKKFRFNLMETAVYQFIREISGGMPMDSGEHLKVWRKTYAAASEHPSPGEGAEQKQKGSPEESGTGIYGFYDLYSELLETDRKIIEYHERFAERGETSSGNSSEDFSDARYFGLEKMKTESSWIPGHPFYERDFIENARELILKRLRPLRMSASHYSLVPGHRHGAMTLNPVMRLWKDRVHPRKKDDPRLSGLELNTKETADCLLRLACLADPALPERRVLRGKIAGMNRNEETLSTMGIFILPGSCFPIREIERQNFPEFRNKVIGETRNPLELGVPPSEDSILTGAWYQKNSHCLFYPAGGDNGMLVRNLWNSARMPGPPAFFFALGQFVHDTLEDHEIYYRRDEKTFRNCVEEYYRYEDHFRKNRGEKTGRKKMDNSRPAVRFMFAVHYARLITEILTGTSQAQFRHTPTETWMERKLKLQLIHKASKDFYRNLRYEVRKTIQEY